MTWIERSKLQDRVNNLRPRGVRFPAKYPAANLDEDPTNLRTTTGQIEVVELLAEHHDPKVIEVEPGIRPGDVDIILHKTPKVYLQVKDLADVHIDKGGVYSKTASWLEVVKREIREEIAKHEGISTFTQVDITKGEDRIPRYSGETKRVDRHPPAHVILIQISADVLLKESLQKLKGSYDEARKQLEEAPVQGVLVPVLNLTRFPHDQAATIKFFRELFNTRQAPTPGGIVLATSDFPGPVRGQIGTTYRRRLIPIPNPHSPEAQRLVERDFNADAGEEWLFQEHSSLLYFERLDKEPPNRLLEFRDGSIYVDGVRFCEPLVDGDSGLNIFAAYGTKESKPNIRFTPADEEARGG